MKRGEYRCPEPAEALYDRIVPILDRAHASIARTVNVEMVMAYWEVGREIVVVEQGGETRATYGDAVIRSVATRLTKRFGKGFSHQNLRNMRQFYLAFPSGSALEKTVTTIRSTLSSKLEPAFPAQLSWSHYAVLMRVGQPMARYEIEAAREFWSVRELERQRVEVERALRLTGSHDF